MTKKDIENILAALGEATFAGLFRFVGKSQMRKIVEVVHCFDKDKFTPGINLPSVRITIEPLSDSDTENYEKRKHNLIN